MAEQQLPPESSEPNLPPSESESSGAHSNQPAFVLPNQPEPEYLLLEWLADSRVARKRSREYYSSLAVIVLLLSLILFFANQVLLIFVLVSFLFVTYVLASVKPDTVHNMITSYGIRYRDKLYFWEQMGRFWVTEHGGKAQVHIEAPAFLSSQIVLLPSNSASPIKVTIEDMVTILGSYLPYEEPNPTQIDRWVQWLEEKFPLEAEVERPQEVAREPELQPTPPAQNATQPPSPVTER